MLDIFELGEEIINEMEKGYVDPDKLSPETVTLIKEIVSVRNKIRKLESKVDELKAFKKGLDPAVLTEFARLETTGVRLDKVLVYVRHNTSAAPFKAVLEVVKKKLEPEVSALLQKTYEKLSKESVSIGVQEAAGFMEGIMNFVKDIFKPSVSKIDSTVKEIEGMLGVNESAMTFVSSLVRDMSERRRTLMEEYSGWKNYETWVVALELNNNRGMYEEIQGFVEEVKKTTKDDEVKDPNLYSNRVVELSKMIKEYVEEIIAVGVDALPQGSNYTFIPTLINAAIQEVEWREIAEDALEY